MAFLGQSYDLNSLPDSNSGTFDPLPPGWYGATITKAELKPTKDGSGEYISLRFDITGPTHQGRVAFGNLNIKNASSKAEEIGRQQLGQMMRAIGLSSVTDTDQLIGGNLQIKLSIREATEQFTAQNEVKGYKASSDSMLPKAAATTSEASQPAKAKSAPPWAAKK
jgi:hypothetical protein